MKLPIATTKIVYYYQGVNLYGKVEKHARIELPGMGTTISDAFEEWKNFMAAVGYLGMEKYELTEIEEPTNDNT